MKHLDTFRDEVSAVLDKQDPVRDVPHSTTEPYSFLSVKLTAKNFGTLVISSYISLPLFTLVPDMYSVFLMVDRSASVL